MRRMNLALIFGALVLLCSSSVYAKQSPSKTMPPAPAPAPAFVNLTQLLSVAGPFHTFLTNLQTTKVIDTFQNQINNSKDGITIFVPTDEAFNSLKKGALSRLSPDQLKQLLLFHAIPHYYSISQFKNLSKSGSTSTFAGGSGYALNFTDASGTVLVSTELVHTNLSSSVYSTPPVGLYEVTRVLLPKAIFGNEVPLAPVAAPAPSPKTSTADADSPSSRSTSSGASSSPTLSSSTSSASHVPIYWGFGSCLALAISGAMVFFL